MVDTDDADFDARMMSAVDRVKCASRQGKVVEKSLTLCDFTDKSFALFGERNNRRRSSAAFGVRDDDRFAAQAGQGCRGACKGIYA